MALPATEDFTYANYTLLENTTDWSVNTVGLAVESNGLYGYTGSHPMCHWNADTFSADQSSELLLKTVSAYHGMGVAVHCQATGGNGYAYYGETNVSQIIKLVSGTPTTLLGSLSVLGANDVIKLEATVSGSTTTLKAYINGVLEGTITDTTYTSGSAGVHMQGDIGNSRADDWTGDDISGGAPTATGKSNPLMGCLGGPLYGAIA